MRDDDLYRMSEKLDRVSADLAATRRELADVKARLVALEQDRDQPVYHWGGEG